LPYIPPTSPAKEPLVKIQNLAFAIALLVPAPIAHGFTFTPDDLYTTNYGSLSINQYTSSGTSLGSISLPAADGDELRGLAFGPDGLLYTAAVRGSAFAVLALNSSGAVVQTYPMSSVYLAGNIGSGKIAVDGTHIYVAGADQLTEFDVGNPTSGSVIYTDNQILDVNILPDGNLLVASDVHIQEITSAGTVVRTINLGSPNGPFTNIQGIQYEPSTNQLFVSELGHTGFSFELMRLDATTGALEANTVFNYASDLFLTDSGQLLVGSRTLAPRLYDQNLDSSTALDGTNQMFVTQFATPEPGGLMLMAIGGATLLFTLSRRRDRISTRQNRHGRAARSIVSAP
jgi:hypothetical protein